jgi:PAS domain S-box-containing protein
MGEIGLNNVEQLQPHQLGFAKFVDDLRDAVIVAEAGAGRVAYWNPASEQLFGYPKEEAIGLPVEALMPPRMWELHRAGLSRFNHTGRGGYIDSGRPIALPAVRKGGEEIVIEATLTALDDMPVPGRFVMAIIRDITSRVREDEALRQSHSRLEAELQEERRNQPR